MTAARALSKWDILDSPEVGWEPHVAQEEVVASTARYRAVAAGRRFGKSDIGGHELIPEFFLTHGQQNELADSGKRREFWVCGPEYCTDVETEILTIDGWRTQGQLDGDEIVLTQDPETGLAAWQQMDGVNVFHSNQRYVYESEFRGHSSVTTGEHRWLVKHGKPGTYYKTQTSGKFGNTNAHPGQERVWRQFDTTEDLGKVQGGTISCAAPVVNLPTQAKYEDAFVELVAWYWTEGQAWGKGIAIAQNEGANFDRIRAACTAMLGPASAHMRTGSVVATRPMWRLLERKGANEQQKGVALNPIAAAEIVSVCRGHDKVVTPEFIASLTQAQLELFIKVSILADANSTWEWGEDVEIGQKVEARIDRLQMACQIAGIRTQKFESENEYGPWYVLSIYVRSNIQAGTIAKNAVRKKHSGIVWCPTTPHGTWLARRRGSVFFTGNSDAEKEFRVIYNSLKRLGVPFDRPGTYYNPENGELDLSCLGGLFQVHGKSAKYPGTLVGEGLSGVILAEAAKLKQSVWTKYLQPTLADFNGWALLTSTPEGRNWFYDVYAMAKDPRNRDWQSWRFPAWVNPYVYKKKTSTADVRKIQQLLRLPDYPAQDVIAKMFNIDDEILSRLFSMTEETFNQEIAALFTEFVGRVFKAFDEDYHVRDLQFDPSWKTFGCVDWGFTNPSVWLLCQESPWGEINVLDEFYQNGLTPAEFGREIKARGLVPEGTRTFYPDPASPGDTRQLEQIIGVRHTGGTGGELKDRLDAIRLALKPMLHHIAADAPGNRPRLLFSRRVQNCIREFSIYRYPKTRDEQNSAELPMKENDHTPEALGRFFAADGTPAEDAQATRVSRANVRG